MRAIAPNADLRPFHSSARSASSAATRTLVAPFARAMSATSVDVLGDAGVEAVDLDEQHGLRVARVSGADEVLDRGRDARVHHLERGRQHTGGDDAAHGRGRVVDRVERAQHRGDAWAGRA